MKAVIAIDVDDDLDLSQIHANVELYSNDLENTFHNGYLLKQVKPLPKHITDYQVRVSFDYDGDYALGWNECLKMRRNRMIEYKQEYTITNDEPIALKYREHLLEDGWRIVSEDTKQTTYQKAIWCKENQNGYSEEARNSE